MCAPEDIFCKEIIVSKIIILILPIYRGIDRCVQLTIKYRICNSTYWYVSAQDRRENITILISFYGMYMILLYFNDFSQIRSLPSKGELFLAELSSLIWPISTIVEQKSIHYRKFFSPIQSLYIDLTDIRLAVNRLGKIEYVKECTVHIAINNLRFSWFNSNFSLKCGEMLTETFQLLLSTF